MKAGFPFWLKMFVISLTGIVITVTMVCLVFISTYSGDVIKNTIHISKDLFYETGMNVDNYLKRCVGAVDRRMISDLHHLSAGKESFLYRQTYLSKATEILQQTLNASELISAIAYSDMDGEIVAVGRLTQLEAADMLGANLNELDLLDGRDIWRYEKANGGMRIAFLRKLIYIDDQYRSVGVGYITVFLNEERLYRKYFGFTNENIGMLVLNEQGIVVSGSDRSKLGEPFTKFFRENGEGRADGADGSLYEVLDSRSEDFTLHYKYTLNLTATMRTINRAIGYVVLIVVVCVILCGLVSLFIYYTVNCPLTALSKSMKAVGEGKYDFTIQTDSGGEIGYLCKSFNSMVSELNRQVNQNLAMQIRIRDSLISAYESQMNPHFIYNTLELIRMMIVGGHHYKAEDAVVGLGTIMKYYLSREKETQIREEVACAEQYLKMTTFRYPEKFRYTIDISEEIKEHYTIKFVLQPFVENAVKHGISDIKRNNYVISILARKMGDDIMFVIKDNGAGIASEKLAELRKQIQIEQIKEEHIGMQNVNQRIKLMYGETYGVDIYSKLGEYTEALIHISAHMRKGVQENVQVDDCR